MANELSVRARRIDDLPELYGEDDGNEESFKYTLGDDDSLLVSHQTNLNGDSKAYVLFSRKLQMEQLKKFIANYIKSELNENWLKEISISNLADGEQFMEDITQALEDMRSKEVNSLMQDSYHRQTDLLLRREQKKDGDPQLSVIVSDEHTFMQDTNAYVHITVNPNIITATTDTIDLITLQVDTNNGWMDICSEPLIKIIKTTPTEIDFHGFFYAGTKIRTYSKNLASNSIFKEKNFTMTGYMRVLETSNLKPFPKESFTWRVGIPSNTKGIESKDNLSKENQSVISSDGFLRVSGNFLNENALATAKKDKSNRFQANQEWTTPFVYIAQRIPQTNSSGIYNWSRYIQLANGNSVVPVAGKTPVKDEFGERYFYLSKEGDADISVFAYSDQRMNDGGGKSNIAGIRNPVTINYIDSDELSIQVKDFEGEDLQKYLKKSTISILFEDQGEGDTAYSTCHRFFYGDILGRPSGISLTAFNSLTASEYGTQKKSLAYIGVASENGPNFIRGRKTKAIETSPDVLTNIWTYSFGESTNYTKYFFTSVKMLSSGACWFDGNNSSAPILSLLIDKFQPTDNINANIENEQNWSAAYEYEVLSTNVSRIGCFPKKITTYSNKSDGTAFLFDKYLTYNDVTSPLLSVVFSKDCCDGLTIEDSAFAFCSRLKDIKIPKGMNMNGNATFFMGYTNKNPTCQAIGRKGTTVSLNTLSYAPLLKTVTFVGPGDGYIDDPIHIENGVLKYTFSMCKSLQSANISHTDAKSLSGTFRFCENLTSLTFPSELTSIGKTTFEGCTHLSNIFFDVNLSYLEKDALKGLPANLTAVNTYSSNKGKYVLGTDYNLGVMLTGDSTLTGENGYYEDTSEKNLKKEKVWEEIEPVAKLMTGSLFMYSTTLNQSRRFYICDKNGTKLKMKKGDSDENNKYAVFSPFTSGGSKKISDLIKQWDTNFTKNNIMSYETSTGIINC